MAKVIDRKFAEAVIAAELVSAAAVKQALEELKVSADKNKSLPGLLVKKGLLTREQAQAITKKIMPKKPKKIGGFEIIEEVGRGGMGTVYKARQVSMDRIVALKVLSPKFARNKKYIARFIREARAVAKLSHINIIQGFDVGEADGVYYFAMEFVDGESVAFRLARDGRISEKEALAIVEQVSRALAHAQAAAGIIHRDIKPDNIMMTNDGIAKLADLGLAKTATDSSAVAAGTPHYISPEQADRAPDVDIRSDIYSLGATLYHMITGSPPFTGSSVDEILNKHRNAQLPSARKLNPALSVGITRLIGVMMAKDRNRRYQNMEELLQDIRRVRDGLPPQKAVNMSLKKSSQARGGAYRAESSGSGMGIVLVVLLAIAGVGLIVYNVTVGNKGGHIAEDDPQMTAAAEAFKQAEAYELKEPWETNKIIRQYVGVAEEYPDTPWAEKAVAKIQELRQATQENARQAFMETAERADELAAQDRFADAFKTLENFPERLRFAEWDKKLAQKTEELERRLALRLKKIQEEAAERAEKHDYQGAVEAIRKTLVFGGDKITNWANEKIAHYEKAEKEYEEELARKAAEQARRKFEKFAGQVIKLEQQGDFAAAAAACDQYLVQQDTPFADEVRRLEDEAKTAKKIWDDAVKALDRSVGKEIEIRARGILLKGELRSVGEEEFTIKFNQAPITRKLAEIDPENLLALAGVSTADQDQIINRANFFLASGAYERAEETAELLKDEAKAAELQERISNRRRLSEKLQNEE